VESVEDDGRLRRVRKSLHREVLAQVATVQAEGRMPSHLIAITLKLSDSADQAPRREHFMPSWDARAGRSR